MQLYELPPAEAVFVPLQDSAIAEQLPLRIEPVEGHAIKRADFGEPDRTDVGRLPTGRARSQSVTESPIITRRERGESFMIGRSFYLRGAAIALGQGGKD